MADYTINAKTSVDVSGLKGYQTAAEAAATATQKLAVTMDAAQTASNALAGAINSATVNLNAFTTAATAATVAAQNATTAMTGLASAMAAVAQVNLAPALAPVTTAIQNQSNATSQLAGSFRLSSLAGRALVQEVGGPMSFVFGQIAAQSSILGPLLAAAFPIIGAVALGDILYTLWQKFDPLIKAEKELEAATKRLDGEYAALGKRLERLEVAEITAEFGKARGALLAFFQAGSDITDDQAAIQKYSTQIAELNKQLEQSISIRKAVGLLGGAGSLFGLFSERGEKAKLEQIAGLTDQMNFLQQKVVVDQRQANLDLANAKKDAAAEAKRAAAEALALQKKQQIDLKSNYDEMLSDLKADHEVTHAEELAFRQNELREIDQWGGKYKDLHKQVYREVATQQQEVFRQQDAATKKTKEEALKIDEENFADEMRLQDENDKVRREKQKEFATEQKRLAIENRKEMEALLTAGSEDRIGGLQGQQQDIQATHAGTTVRSTSSEVEYLEKLKEIDRQIIQEKLQTQLQKLQIDSLDSPEKAAANLQKLAALQIAGQRTLARDEDAILKTRQAQYVQFFNTINQGFANAVASWATGQRSFAASMQALWTQIATQFIANLVKMTVAHAVQTAIQVSTTASAASTSAGIAKASALQQSLIDAKLAFKNTYASVSAIPIVGPYLAPEAAALAFAAVAAFEQGTDYVPQTGMALIHKGERVVSAGQNQQITNAITNGGAGGNTFNGGIHVNVNGGGGGRKAGEDAASSFQQKLRRMNLVMQ